MLYILKKFWGILLLAFYILIWVYQIGITNNPSLDSFNYIYDKAKDIFTIVFAIISLVIAVEGLNTWKNQLKGTKRFEASDKLQSKILLTNVYLNRSFSLVNQFFTYPFDSLKTKLLVKQFYQSDFQMLTSEKEKLEELIVYAILHVKHMPKDTTAIVTSFSKILVNYQHFISMIDEQTPEYDFLEDKNNFAKSNLDKHVNLSYDYINAIKL